MRSRRKEDERRPRAARGGFSLIVVLIIALIGLGLIGVAFYIYESSSGRGTVAMRRALEYNYMVNAIGQAQSALIESMNNENDVPRRHDYNPNTSRDVAEPGDLLVDPVALGLEVDGMATSQYAMTRENVALGGRTGSLAIEIFDIVYGADDINPNMTPAVRAQMPAAARLGYRPPPPDMAPPGGLAWDVDPYVIELGGTEQFRGLGAYLIRATLILDGERKVLEAAFLQRNDAPYPVGGGGNVSDPTTPIT